ncbi:hypothetical protein DB346_12505 [Verrucomicrobia bacterium LW23]|nr:hypothetical protein DB346_12505 [Verrucomicrobia bacterium LW23]
MRRPSSLPRLAALGLLAIAAAAIASPTAAPGQNTTAPPAAQSPATAAAPEWKSASLGNIFDAGGAPAELTLRPNAAAESVTWKVYDFWHQQVAAGTAAIKDGAAVIRPGVTAVGYYLLSATPVKDGAPPQDVYTSFAIVRPHKTKDPLASPFGVMTHFAQGMNPAMLDTFKRIGIESIRDEHYWAQVEREKGVYLFPEKSDAYMEACRRAGIAPLIAMTFGNKLYDHPEGPTTPEGFAGYANYGEAILKKYGPEVRWLEIWNEYNGTWAPPAAKKNLVARYTTYTAMLKASYEKIKAVRPDVQVLGGAAVLIPLPYFEGIFKLGGLQYMDGIVIHPYRGTPEGVDKEVAELKDLMRKYNNGKDKPIWVTETGRHTKDEYDWERGRKMYEKGRAEGARYLARQYTLLLKEGCAKIYWYLASDHATFVSMGLLRHHHKEASGMGEYAVAPAYVAYANLIHHLDGAVFSKREAWREYTRAHVCLFTRGNGANAEQIRVAWATQPARITVKPAPGARLTAANLMGTDVTLTPGPDGTYVLDLTQDPIYLRGEAQSVAELDTGIRVLASLQDDYTKTQGGNNWFYGYTEAGGPFTELSQVETMWGYNWGGVKGAKNLSVSQGSAHPEIVGGKPLDAVYRWRSPVTGRLTLRGAFTNSGKGDGVHTRILLDGKELHNAQAGGKASVRAEFEVTTDVAKDQCIDFTINAGAGTAFDATSVEVMILDAK